MNIAGGGSAKSMIVAVIHIFLLDSAYARMAEKARNQYVHGTGISKTGSGAPLKAVILSISVIV